MSDLEYCCECWEETGNAGRDEDSIYIGVIGPLCENCASIYQESEEQ